MTVPEAGTPAEPPRGTGWVVLTASERGAAHVALRTPNQDSVGFERAGAAGVVAAAADGHGHSRHLRSARGSRLAVRIGCRLGQELADRLTADGSLDVPDSPAEAASLADHITGLAESFLVPAIVRRWREAVLADVDAEPFTRTEEGKRWRGDDPTIAYGSTLLLCLAISDWLIVAQIGDGDVVGVRLDGTAELPVPADPALDGMVTTSLCGPHAAADFRVAVVDTGSTPLLAVLLATDGYGNAQVVDRWPDLFSRDLAWLLRQHDTRWLAGQLPAWAARCASADGSADDTTVALLISPAGQSGGPAMPSGGADESAHAEPDLGSDETTTPAVTRTDTVPNAQRTAGPVRPAEPITVRLNHVGQAAEAGPSSGCGQTTGPATANQATGVPADSGQLTAEREPPEPMTGSSLR